MEFLGNKRALLPLLLDVFDTYASPGSTFVDLFSGTGTVSGAMADAGYIVHANDQLPLASMWSTALLGVHAEPQFTGLAVDLGPPARTKYEQLIDYLNTLDGHNGWVTNNYTPLSLRSTPYKRMYFSEENGKRIDIVRDTINSWKPLLKDAEWALLMGSLIAAASSTSNVAGTYGCFLKEWKPRALNPIVLKPLPVQVRTAAHHSVTTRDAQLVAEETDATVAYADPPYTKRQYAAYYHLLNSIVQSSDPEITGKTGLPTWQQWSSDWCYSRRAPQALDNLVAKNSSPVFILSYSSDGHISHEEIVGILSQYGRTNYHETERKRFKSSTKLHSSKMVTERTYVMSR